jgi:ubiquinone/menaquinone biosynthesis C-methylase UbiE
LILRHLPVAPAAVVDVGGGSGAYACWLAALGYEVLLIEPVPKHIEQALANSVRQQRPIASLRVGDARHLEFDDRSADAVLFLGPLYHLTDHSDRITSLREAYRVLRPGGVVFAAAISHFASLMDSLLHGFFDKPEFAPILEGDLRDGQHRNPTGNPDYFTTAFFHRPDELKAELEEAGFRVLELAAVEGPGWVARDFDRLWADEAQRARLLDSIRKVEHEPALLGASPHLLAIGKK